MATKGPMHDPAVDPMIDPRTGEYAVIARHDGKTYQSTFRVQTGLDRDVEVVAQETGQQPAKDVGQERD